ncbi:ATP-dependent RNA helicase DDX24 [Dendropsophus ebraccatus]|uniref:ATP-dependent RNA helicase DDX24 n=1 Tax=Dendropsophus ebraccatus TaxID=150705 RepID=UPI003831A2A4
MKRQKVKTGGRALAKLQRKGIRITGRWKPITLDPTALGEGQMEEIICFEELTDYQMVRTSKELEKEGRKRKRNTGEEEAPGEEGRKRKRNSEEEEGRVSRSKKNKKRRKKMEAEKLREESEDEMEETLQEEEGEGEEMAAPDEEERGGEEKPQLGKNKKRKKKKPKAKGEQRPEEAASTKPGKKTKNWAAAALAGAGGKEVDVSAWKDLYVPPPVLRALSHLGFSTPTPIQALTLPSAIRDKMDVLGAAETGSGKTLAFAIPMIHAVLEWRKVQERGASGGEEKGDTETDKAESLQEDGEEEAESLQEDGEEEAESLQEDGEEEAESLQEDGEETDKAKSLQEDGEEEAESLQEDGEETDKAESLQEDGEEEAESLQEDGEEADQAESEEEDYSTIGCVKVVKDVDVNFNSAPPQMADAKRPLLGLVVTPTRELAVQVRHHIDAVARFTGIKTAIVVGGMAPQKQQRVLHRRPEIVIATPGRLWEMIKEKHPHLCNLRQLRCLVIDEADRMVEKGHYAELSQLLEMLSDSHYHPQRQTFVFSATLTLIHQAPSRLLQKKNYKKMDKEGKLESLMDKIGLKGKPKVIDLSRRQATVETLSETRIHCSSEEKDLYLYYFLLQYPGRTMVFANSIDCIKRLTSLLGILECNPLPLHANMHQKQRLKNLERFAERESCVLLTTDVAARGLDIPNIQHVLHYQVPRTSETYVHRSGRTARASSDGLSLLLIGPDDMINYRKILRTLEKNEELPIFPVEAKCMNGIKERVDLARQIEKMEYFNSKAKQQNSWIQQAAEALDIELDDDDLIGGKQDAEVDAQKQKALKMMKKQLKRLLSQPIFKNFMKTKYPTQSGQLPLPSLPLSRAESALHTLSEHKSKKDKRKRKPRH